MCRAGRHSGCGLASTTICEEQKSAAVSAEAEAAFCREVPRPPFWDATALASLGEAVSCALGGSGEFTTLWT